MGLSKAKTTTGPSKVALPYIKEATGAVQDVYRANAPRLSEIGSSLFDAYKAYSGNMGQDLAGVRGYTGDVLGGKYLDQGNPYLANIIGQTNESVADRVNALFSQAGQTGSSRQIGELGKQLSDTEARLRYQDYASERDRMAQAAQLGLGTNAAVNANQATLAALGANAAEVPYIGAEKLAGAIGGLWGNAQTTKSSPSIGSLLAQAAGNVAAGYAASDRRTKTDIIKLGAFEDGLGVYEFSYRDDLPDAVRLYTVPGRQIGVMADEVARFRPDALGPIINGYATVDYGKLTKGGDPACLEAPFSPGGASSLFERAE